MATKDLDVEKVVQHLNRLLELELAGVVRYTHYSLMVFGHARIPIVSWLRGEAITSMEHAQEIGEWVTTLGGHPSLRIGPLLETHKHEIGDILAEVLEHEKEGVEQFHETLAMVAGQHVALEEFLRGMILVEENHISEVDKMIRHPGELEPAR